jgi:predicted 3-demethylubiquinone-9 3-methyltransferase (glyoxalase superfamily)
MAYYSAMKSYIEKNNLHYITFFPNSETPIKAVIRHLPPDTPAEDNSNSVEDLGFNVINVKQMTVTQRAPNEQSHVELPSLFTNITSQETFS